MTPTTEAPARSLVEQLRASPVKSLGKFVGGVATTFALLYVLFYVVGDHVSWIRHHDDLVMTGLASLGYFYAGWLW